MKLTYWTAENLNDHNCYSIRARTKREATALKNLSPQEYGTVTKVVVEYKDGFDLMSNCLNEGNLWEERKAQSDANKKQFNW